jgi:hypothetical protein
LLIVVVAIIIATFDWNRLKPTINQKVSTELNRPFAIRGDLGVVWERQKEETGWRSWIPGRTFTPTTSFSATRRISRTSPWSTCRALKPRWPARAADQNGLSAVDQTSAARCAPDPPF